MATELEGGGHGGAELGFGGKKEPGADKERARGGADSARIRTRAVLEDGRRVSQRWPAAVATCVAPWQSRGRRKGG